MSEVHGDATFTLQAGELRGEAIGGAIEIESRNADVAVRQARRPEGPDPRQRQPAARSPCVGLADRSAHRRPRHRDPRRACGARRRSPSTTKATSRSSSRCRRAASRSTRSPSTAASRSTPSSRQPGSSVEATGDPDGENGRPARSARHRRRPRRRPGDHAPRHARRHRVAIEVTPNSNAESLENGAAALSIRVAVDVSGDRVCNLHALLRRGCRALHFCSCSRNIPRRSDAPSPRQGARRLRGHARLGRDRAADRRDRSHLGVRLRARLRHPRQGQGAHAAVRRSGSSGWATSCRTTSSRSTSTTSRPRRGRTPTCCAAGRCWRGGPSRCRSSAWRAATCRDRAGRNTSRPAASAASAAGRPARIGPAARADLHAGDQGRDAATT